ncbi:YiiX/YebB-like N1pC/P60 family cysteine hydrolase [Thiofilum flexile]|uniref:YiiX/YebB-like N1pC/P60 family cysteine hydrolase n=1 Tax=Thiofilum flexile TaxID=125627 RepID=UPI00037FCD94|nr:YiiX/YebB-like N1pC/P60 family cysteine hydrolase [Thiofilum flexile]
MIKRYLLSACLSIILTGYTQADALLTTQVNPNAPTSSYQRSGIPLQTGQIIVTESPEPLNTLYMLLYPEFSPFIHVGIVEVEGNQAFVYESSGDYKLGLDQKPPTDHVTGHVRRITLTEFINESGGTVSFYSPPNGINLAKVIQYSQNQVSAQTPFDAYFNYTDHSRLYCSEFIAMALEAGGAPPYRTVPMKLNPSLQVVVNWLKVRDRTILPVEQLVTPQRWVGTLSQTHTLTALKIDRAIKAELYRRFTTNQKLGNILAWKGRGVGFQPSITTFREKTFATFDDATTYSAAQVLAQVEEMANKYLGPFTGAKVSVCKIDFSLCP